MGCEFLNVDIRRNKMAVIDRVLIGEGLVIEERPDGSGLDLKMWRTLT